MRHIYNDPTCQCGHPLCGARKQHLSFETDRGTETLRADYFTEHSEHIVLETTPHEGTISTTLTASKCIVVRTFTGV